ncbi:hypothetical protein LCGC14_1544100, partial [marine sediment metagenome]
IICANVPLVVEKKVELLAIANIQNRLETLASILAAETEVLELEHKINTKVRKKLEKTQKEYFLHEQLKEIQKELGTDKEDPTGAKELEEKIKAKNLPQEIHVKCEKELKRLARMQPISPESALLRTYLEWITDLPWTERTPENKDIDEAQKILDEDHYDLKEVKERVLDFIAVRLLKEKTKGPILCFVGPPGTGKTSLGRSVARALGREFIRVSLGGIRDEAEIRGHRKTYVGALPGKIIQAMKKAGRRNPVFLLDEIDKMSSDFRGDPASALLEVLDPEQNSSFADHYLEVPYDLSDIMFITTANSVHNIPFPLRDRMEIIHIPGYTEFEKTGREAGLQIIKNAINFNGIDDLDFHIQCNLYEDALMSIGENVFVEIQGNNAEFYTVDSGETVPDDCYTVLEKVIKPYYCQLAQVDGYWSIINQQEYVSEYDIFDYSTLTQSTGGGAVDRTVSITSHYRPADSKFELSKNPAIKILRLLFRNKNLGSNEIATNPDFEDGGTPPAGWSNSGWDAFSTTTLGDGNKVGNTTESTTNSDSKYIEVASFTLAGVTTSEQDFVQSSFRVKIKSITFSSPGVRHPVVYAALVDPLSNLIPGNIASLSEVDGEFVVIEDSFPITLNGLYSLRLYVVPHATSPTSQLTYYWDDLNVVHSSTANTTTDSLYINTSASAGYQVIEEEIYFADSFQESDIGALNDGVTLTSSWTRYNKAPENLSLAYLFAQQYLNDRQAYHDLLRIDLFDIDGTINFHSILVLDSKYYSFSEYSKNSKTKLISGTLKQVDNTSDVSFTFSPQTLLSKFGESSQTVEFDTIGFATQTWALSTFGSKTITEEISGLWDFTHATGLKVGGIGFTSTDIGNWNTAFGWGDHSTAGYVTSAMQNFIDDLTPQAGGHISMGAYKIVQGVIDTLGLSIDDNAGNVTIDGGLTVTLNNLTVNAVQVATQTWVTDQNYIDFGADGQIDGTWNLADQNVFIIGPTGAGQSSLEFNIANNVAINLGTGTRFDVIGGDGIYDDGTAVSLAGHAHPYTDITSPPWMSDVIDDTTPQLGGHLSLGANKLVQGAVDTSGISVTSSGGNVTIDGGLTVTANSITKNGAQVATEAYADAASGADLSANEEITGTWNVADQTQFRIGPLTTDYFIYSVSNDVQLQLGTGTKFDVIGGDGIYDDGVRVLMPNVVQNITLAKTFINEI